jgi:hypothetical protein
MSTRVAKIEGRSAAMVFFRSKGTPEDFLQSLNPYNGGVEMTAWAEGFYEMLAELKCKGELKPGHFAYTA